MACHDLAVGDLVLCEDGQWAAVEDVLDTGVWETVYNLRIADFHTYFVGGEEWGFSVWAHNAACTPEEVLNLGQRAGKRIGQEQAEAISLAIERDITGNADALLRGAGLDLAHPEVAAFRQSKGFEGSAVYEPTANSRMGFENLYPEEVDLTISQRPRTTWSLEQREGGWYVVDRSTGWESKAKGSYDFVVRDGELVLARPVEGGSTHTYLGAEGPIDYAGQVFFGNQRSSRGVMRRWTNGSGHFEPYPQYAHQAVEAGLPREFFSPVRDSLNNPNRVAAPDASQGH